MSTTLANSPLPTVSQEHELSALRRMLATSHDTFSLGIAICNSPAVRSRLIQDLQASTPSLKVVNAAGPDILSAAIAATTTANPAALFLVDLESLVPSDQKDYPILRALNASRELWARSLPLPVIFWVPEYLATLLSIHARDFWAWKSHQFEFLDTTEPRPQAAGLTNDGLSANLSVEDKQARIIELESRIHAAGDQPSQELVPHLIAWLRELGHLYAMLNGPSYALPAYARALDLARRHARREDEGDCLNDIGIVYAKLGDPCKAIEHYQQHLAIARQIGDRRGEGNALGNLGIAYASLGETRKAIVYFEQHLAIAHEIGDRHGEGTALGNLGNAYADLGETRKAIEHYQQDLAIARQIGNRRGEGNALGNLGTVYAALGETRKAIECFEQDLALTREIGDRRGEGTTLGNLGIAYASLGETRKAIVYFEQHLAIAHEIGDRHGEGSALGNLGNAYADLGETRKAIEYHEQHLAIARQIGDRRGEALTSWNLAVAYQKAGDLARAIPLVQLRVDYEREIGHPDAAKHAATLESLRAELNSPAPDTAAPSHPNLEQDH